MDRPVILMNRAGFYPPGWVSENWPILSKVADIRLAENEGKPEFLREAAEADIIYSRNPSVVGRDVLAAGTGLRAVVTASAGTEKIDIAAASELGIAVANSPGNTAATAEATMLLALALVKRLPFWMALAKSGEDIDRAEVCGEVLGRTIGIVGLGRIGRATAVLARAFGMNVLAYGPRVKESDLAEVVTLDELLRRSDIVSLHAGLNAETRGMIDREKLGLMKPTAFMVNTARGGLIDEAALVEALRLGKIAGAGLDVFEVEPPRRGNPLLDMPNVIATPHRLGHAAETRRRCSELAEKNILSMLRGELPEFTLNPDLKWRADGAATPS